MDRKAREGEFSLSEHHRELEAHFQRLMARCEEGDPIELRCEWSLFERELGEHMELEEKQLLPAFRRHDPAAAAQILREHTEIRSALAELGISLDLHAVRAEQISAFIDRLRAHARREDELFYPWMERHIPAERWESTARQLGALTRNIAAVFGVGAAGPGASSARGN